MGVFCHNCGNEIDGTAYTTEDSYTERNGDVVPTTLVVCPACASELEAFEAERAVDIRHYFKPIEVCGYCHGTGREPGSDTLNWLPCPTCRGEGTVNSVRVA